MTTFHEPVLLKEAIEYLNIKPGEKYIDATVGGGGHTEVILKKGGKVLGLDLDPEAIEAAKQHLTSACPNASWQLAQGNFAHLKKISEEHQFTKVAGIIFDLGVSSHQLEKMERGFSFNSEAPLDMRMDLNQEVTAADLVNGLTEKELAELFFKLGDEPFSRRIAAAIAKARQTAPIKIGKELAEIIAKVKPRQGKLHPATRCFQALRIAVNDELNNLRQGLAQAIKILGPKGRLVVISFHSGEDRIVKLFFKDQSNLEVLTKKPIEPTREEIMVNPRSRSAKLRAAEKK